MTRIRVFKFALASLLCLVVWDTPIYAQENTAEVEVAEESSAPALTTTSDPQIPVDELQLLLKPLTLSELEGEAEGWRSLLRSKVQEISDAEIAIKRENAIIARRAEAAATLEQAQQSLSEAETALGSVTPGTPEYEAAARTLEEAKEKLGEAQEALEEARAARETIQEDEALQGALAEAEQTGLFNEARRVLESARRERDTLSAGSPEYQIATVNIDALDSAINDTEGALEAQQSAPPDSPEYEERTQELEAARETLRQATEAAASAEDTAARILNQARRDREALPATSLAYRETTQQIRDLQSTIEDFNAAQEFLDGITEESPERAEAEARVERVRATLEQATREAARLDDNAKRILSADIAERDALEEGSPAYVEANQQIERLEAAIVDFEAAQATLAEIEVDTPDYEQAVEALETARANLQDVTEAATPAVEKAQQTLYRARQAQNNFDGSIPDIATERIQALEAAIAEYEEAQAAVEESEENEQATQALATAEQVMADAAAGAADASVVLVNAQRLLTESQAARETLAPDSSEYTSATEAIEGLQAAITNFESTLIAGGQVADLRTPLRQASQTVVELLPTPTATSTPAETTTAQTEVTAESDSTAAQQLEEVSADLQAQAEAEAELKNQLVATVTELQSQRTALADRFKEVLNEIDAKGGDTTAYRNYLTAVSGVVIDIQDTEGLGVRIISWLQSEEGGLRWAWNLATFSGIVVGVSIGSQIIAWILGFGMTRFGGASKVLRQFVVMLISRGGIIVGILLGLTALEVSLGPILALLGGASFVLAFALQSNLGNFASGLMIMVNKPFDIGDEVVVAGVWGFVHSFDITSTRIAGYYCQIFTIPNNAIWSGTIENRSIKGGVRQGMIDVHVPLTSNWKQVAQLLEQSAQDAPDGKLRFASFWSLNEHFAKFRIRWEADHSKFWSAYDQIHMNIKKYLEAAGIPFALPTTILMNGYHNNVPWDNNKEGRGISEPDSLDAGHDAKSLPSPRFEESVQTSEAKDPATTHS